ncbi:MAG: class I SAM-dependent methyltransferase [Gammaproteobacteria bacterium]|nr:MAG: class I SAM-dependent methyltransferase [Gammaproteobacteria bacterium]
MAAGSDEALHKRPAAAPDGALLRFFRRQVLARLARLERGRLTVTDAMGRAEFGGGDGNSAGLRIADLSAYADIVRRGTIGAAEAYMQGKWTASDLTALVRLMVANRETMEGIEAGLARLVAPVQRLSHWWRRNTRRQARRNIGAHYDLGNEFYALFLDATMSYSAGIFPGPASSLEEAAVHKLDLICRKLDLRPGDHLLEIGTGWGGLALHAASRCGCRVTTTTLSARQREYAQARVRAAGLEGRVTVLDRDYRDLEGQFDKLVSVEMIEAVGLGFLDEYFRVCNARLRPGGRMLLQGIVIADQLYEQARRSVDFIQQYIFPGGALPSLAAIQAAVARSTELRAVGLQDIGEHYARTLREWRRRFMAQLPAVRQLGFGEEFIRMWEFYLAYCEGGFLERSISDVQLVLDKPGGVQPLPA